MLINQSRSIKFISAILVGVFFGGITGCSTDYRRIANHGSTPIDTMNSPLSTTITEVYDPSDYWSSDFSFYQTVAMTIGESQIVLFQPQTKRTQVIQFDPQLYSPRSVSQITAECDLVVQTHIANSNQILRADQNGNILEVLYQSPIREDSISVYSPRISPSKPYVAYVVFSGEQYFETAQFQDVEIAPLDGSSPPVRLTEHGGAASDGGTWSPEGNSIAYTDYDDDGFLQIYATDLDDWSERQYTHFQEKKSPASPIEWSPSGQYLAVILKNASQAEEIWVYSTKMDQYFKIDLPSGISELSETFYWSKDGKTILVQAEDFEDSNIAGLYWIDVTYKQLILYLSEEQARQLSPDFQFFSFLFPVTMDLSQVAFYNSMGLWQVYDSRKGKIGEFIRASNVEWGSHIIVTIFEQDSSSCQ